MALRTVDYVDVLSGSADLAGLDRANIPGTDFFQFRQAHDRRLQTAWEFDYWPELIRVEKRYYRDLYSTVTAYTAPSLTSAQEVYFPATGLYYQTLVATTGNDPADSLGVTNKAFWADSASTYSASNYAAATTYARGDKVFYPLTDRFYQLYAASSIGNLPSDATKWGVLTEFDRYVAYLQPGKTAIGNVLEVDSLHPKLTTHGNELDWFLSENGVQVLTNSGFAFVTYKLRTIRLKGNLWVSGTSYVVGDQSYYSTGVPGNFYDCIQATSAQAPTNASFWTKTDIPLIFQRYLELSGYCDWLRNNGQGDKADDVEVLSQNELANQSQLLVGAQSQTKRTLVSTR